MLWVCAEEPGEGGRDPEAQAVKAVEQAPPEAVAQGAPEFHDQIPGAVLGLEEVGNPPDAEDAEDQVVEVHVCEEPANQIAGATRYGARVAIGTWIASRNGCRRVT